MDNTYSWRSCYFIFNILKFYINCALKDVDERLLCPDLSIAQIAAMCIQLIILLKTKTRNSWGDLSYVIVDGVDTGMS